MNTHTDQNTSVHLRDLHLVGYRTDPGDIAGLAASLALDGMFRPILVTKRDNQLIVVHGERRVQAAESLGWNLVPAIYVATMGEAIGHVLDDDSTNITARKLMKRSEICAFIDNLEAMGDPVVTAAQARQMKGLDLGRLPREVQDNYHRQNRRVHREGVVNVMTAPISGMAAGTLGKLRMVWAAARYDLDPRVAAKAKELMDKLDTGRMAIRTAYDTIGLTRRELSGVKRPERHQYKTRRAYVLARKAEGWTATEIAEDLGISAESVRNIATRAGAEPFLDKKTHVGKLANVEKARKMAGEGYNRLQIAQTLGYTPTTISKWASEYGFKVKSFRDGGRLTFDPNRPMEQIVNSLADLETIEQLIDFKELDPDRLHDWAESLSASVRTINRIRRAIEGRMQ